MEDIKINEEGKIEITTKQEAKDYIALKLEQLQRNEDRIEHFTAQRDALISSLENLIK